MKLSNFEQLFEVVIYASDKAVRGVRQQGEYPIAFEGWKLKEGKTWYSVHEKEMMVVVHCGRVWRVYLVRSKFVCITNNVANTFFKTQKKLRLAMFQWEQCTTRRVSIGSGPLT